jgi:hypothetical protein
MNLKMLELRNLCEILFYKSKLTLKVDKAKIVFKVEGGSLKMNWR